MKYISSKDLQKRIAYFVGFSTLVVIMLISTPVIQQYTESTFEMQTGQHVIRNLFQIFRIILGMSLVIAIVRCVNLIVFGAAFRKTSEYEISSLLRTVLSIIIYIVAFFIIFQTQYPSIELTALFTGSTILGIVVGLALQDTLGNLFAGIAIQADQSFQVGDVISIGNHGMGTVEGVSWRGVKIRTFQNKLLVISNSVIGKETLEIASRGSLNARIVRFNTLYTNSPAKVMQVVRETVRQVENVSPKRRPKVRIWNLGDNGIDWEIKYWTINYRRHNDTDALIRKRIWYAFQREGLDFAYPTRTIYMSKQSEEEEVFIETYDEIRERISNVDIFAPLSDEEIRLISKTCLVRVFAPEEPIITNGQKGDSMFLIHRGEVRVQVADNGIPKTISTLNEGKFFGEASFLTGKPRSVDVIANLETKVIEIQSGVLRPILKSHPDLVKTISEIVEERRELLAKREEQKKDTTDVKTTSMFKSIKKFFGLK